jgi:NADH:ubiquinone oxidoreductase subunit K
MNSEILEQNLKIYAMLFLVSFIVTLLGFYGVWLARYNFIRLILCLDIIFFGITLMAISFGKLTNNSFNTTLVFYILVLSIIDTILLFVIFLINS